ncbi:MAG: hypothetical protein IIB02_08430 [Thaumarchaeota archaeon]|nr:hypothetical protein [Nitrososphaerota archaeon]
MTTTKTFEELSENEIRYVLSLRCIDVKDYLLKIHGEKCFSGFIKRFVNCSIQNLTPTKVIKQNEAWQHFMKMDLEMTSDSNFSLLAWR